MLRFLKKILQLIINPTKGWEDVSYDNDTPSELCRKGFYPLLAICALSCFMLMFHYGGNHSLIWVIERAIIIFTSYFASFFFAEYVLSVFIPKCSSKEQSLRRNATFVICILSIMVLIEIISNVILFGHPVSKFLPLFVLIVIYRGDRYMAIKPDCIGKFMFVSVLGIMAPPYLLQFILNSLLM